MEDPVHSEEQDIRLERERGGTNSYVEGHCVDIPVPNTDSRNPPTEENIGNVGDATRGSVLQMIDEAVVREMTFTKIEDAEKFYYAYAGASGFRVRKNDVKKGKAGQPVKYREWVCNFEGFRKEIDGHDRKREAATETRCGCKACFRVAHDRFTGSYLVTKFEAAHNHHLQADSKRNIPEADKALLSLLTDVGFKPCKVMDFLDLLAGGVGNLSFKRPDAYNFLYKLRLEKVNGGDVNAVLRMLESMKEQDNELIYKYTVDDDGSLTRLFWCDGMSRAEYIEYGDVVVFDSTYKTNKYKFPLILFSGVNNHRSTCFFAGAIMYNETIESYKWLLRTFVEAMDGRIPLTVLTDQDASMCVAIQEEFPGAAHRLCSWHLSRNSIQKIHLKHFTVDFIELLKRRCSVDEFELSWLNLVEAYELSENNWVTEMFEKRELWADAFFRGQFMAGMTTTQRAESMNALFKLSMDRRMTLIDFMSHFFRTVRKIRSDFISMQEECENKALVVKGNPLWRLEKHAATICTRKIFKLIRSEIKREQGLICEARSTLSDNTHLFTFGLYDSDHGEKTEVLVDEEKELYQCDCLMVESDGIPCCHLIGALKILQKKEFPDKVIHPRWRIDTGSTLKYKFPGAMPPTDSQQVRFAQSNKEMLNLSVSSSKSSARHHQLMEGVVRLAREMMEIEQATESTSVMETNPNVEQVHVAAAENNIVAPSQAGESSVRDPTPIRTKGEKQTNKRKCSFCREEGHTITTCHQNPNRRTRARKNNDEVGGGVSQAGDASVALTDSRPKTSTKTQVIGYQPNPNFNPQFVPIPVNLNYTPPHVMHNFVTPLPFIYPVVNMTSVQGAGQFSQLLQSVSPLQANAQAGNVANVAYTPTSTGGQDSGSDRFAGLSNKHVCNSSGCQ